MEAETVRTIFRTYLELGSVYALERWLDENGIRSKRRTTRAGRATGGRSFSRGALFHLGARRMDALERYLSAANIGSNLFHQNRTVSWLMSMPRYTE